MKPNSIICIILSGILFPLASFACGPKGIYPIHNYYFSFSASLHSDNKSQLSLNIPIGSIENEYSRTFRVRNNTAIMNPVLHWQYIFNKHEIADQQSYYFMNANFQAPLSHLFQKGLSKEYFIPNGAVNLGNEVTLFKHVALRSTIELQHILHSHDYLWFNSMNMFDHAARENRSGLILHVNMTARHLLYDSHDRAYVGGTSDFVAFGSAGCEYRQGKNSVKISGYVPLYTQKENLPQQNVMAIGLIRRI